MYLLDANTFIEAKNLYYTFGMAPGFWEWLTQAHANRLVASIDAVFDELQKQKDELARWAKQLPSSFWVCDDYNTIPSLGLLAAWASSPQRAYREAARDEFLASADFRLVAIAHAGKHTVVTREVPSPDSKKRILLPDACAAHGVSVTQPFRIYEGLGLNLVQS